MKTASEFFDNLKDGRCKGCKYGDIVSAMNSGWTFLGCYHAPYKGKMVSEIKKCPKQTGGCES